MKLLVSTLLAFALSVNAGRAIAGCGDNVGDAEAVAAARAQVAADCDCAGTPSHGAYVSCAAGVANERANAEPPLLPKYCKGAVKKCAARSTCGKPGFVACCRTSSSGKTKCSTKRDTQHCIAPAGGAACTSDPAFSSCCDACTDSGCAAPPTATTVP